MSVINFYGPPDSHKDNSALIEVRSKEEIFLSARISLSEEENLFSLTFFKSRNRLETYFFFLDAITHLYKRVCTLVRQSIRPKDIFFLDESTHLL